MSEKPAAYSSAKPSMPASIAGRILSEIPLPSASPFEKEGSRGISDTEFAKQLFAQQNITVLPGSYLSRDFDGVNPGLNHVRIALVAPLDECVEAAQRIKNFLNSL